MEWKKDQYLINDNKDLLQIDVIHNLLSKSYWAGDRPLEKIEKSLERSLCLGMYLGERQIGFARAVTDGIIFSWICDVIIEENFRGRGLGK